MKTGFTLIELLVVVLIIGILAAIALPQYQKAVLKSRYSGLMPITAAVANAQEIYYMEHGNYAPPSRTSDLAIQIPNNTDNVEIEVSDESDTHFNYVMASRDDLPGVAYVIYQKHSEQFPGTIMCEANEELNSQSTWLCHNSLRGNQVTGSLLGNGWTAYVLEGNGSGDFSAGETTDLTGSFTVDDLNDTFKDIFSSGCCADDWEDYWEDTQDAGRTVSVISPNEIIVYDTDGSEYDHYLFNPTEHYMDVIAASGYITRRYLNESNNSYTCYQSISPTGEILINGC